MSDLIGEMTNVRASNNKLWMAILEIALEHAPDVTKPVLREILAHDKKVSALLAELAK